MSWNKGICESGDVQVCLEVGQLIPDYQQLMRPVLEQSQVGEARISDVVETLATKLRLSEEERAELLPSGKQTKFANRVNWAKSYLKQAGLVESTGRGRFKITERGVQSLNQSSPIDNTFLEQFAEFREFQSRTGEALDVPDTVPTKQATQSATPDETLRKAFAEITSSLSSELLDRVRKAPPAFFERLIVDLLVGMGYGGSAEQAGRQLGQSGDGGVDGVIDQDALGVDQVYIQAKRYGEGNSIGAGAIRDFFGALALKRAQKGIFVTTSTFSSQAVQTARDLNARIVLIDGDYLAKLMIRHNVGCRDQDVLHVKRVDEDYFE